MNRNILPSEHCGGRAGFLWSKGGRSIGFRRSRVDDARAFLVLGWGLLLAAVGAGGALAGGVVLVAQVDCADSNLVITIVAGDGPFNVTGGGPGLPLNGIGTGVVTLQGPAIWKDVTVIETAGDQESINFGAFNCTSPLAAIDIPTADWRGLLVLALLLTALGWWRVAAGR